MDPVSGAAAPWGVSVGIRVAGGSQGGRPMAVVSGSSLLSNPSPPLPAQPTHSRVVRAARTASSTISIPEVGPNTVEDECP